MKRSWMYMLMVLMVMGLIGCGKKEAAQATEPIAETAKEATEDALTSALENAQENEAGQVTIGMHMQLYGVSGVKEKTIYQDGIIEIPCFQSDVKSDVVDALNEQILSDLMPIYEDGMEEERWPEIKSYLYSDENYEQVVTTGITYPNYGTDGDIFSYVYSKADQRAVTLSDAIAAAGTTEEELQQMITDAYGTLSPDMILVKVRIAAFRYTNDGVHFYPMLTAYAEGADEWEFFGEFCLQDKSLTMGEDIHFADDSDGSLVMFDPPLYYGQEHESEGDIGEEKGLNSFGESIYAIQMFAEGVQNLIEEKDMVTLAYSVSYPITVQVAGKEQTFEDAGALAEMNFDDVFSPKMCDGIMAEDCENLFTNGEGTMMGDGAVWFALCDIDMGDGTIYPTYKIITINSEE